MCCLQPLMDEGRGVKAQLEPPQLVVGGRCLNPDGSDGGGASTPALARKAGTLSLPNPVPVPPARPDAWSTNIGLGPAQWTSTHNPNASNAGMAALMIQALPARPCAASGMLTSAAASGCSCYRRPLCWDCAAAAAASAIGLRSLLAATAAGAGAGAASGWLGSTAAAGRATLPLLLVLLLLALALALLRALAEARHQALGVCVQCVPSLRLRQPPHGAALHRPHLGRRPHTRACAQAATPGETSSLRQVRSGSACATSAGAMCL
jgi:hypothetical protein